MFLLLWNQKGRQKKNSVCCAFTDFILWSVCVLHVQYVFWGSYCLNSTLINSWTWCQFVSVSVLFIATEAFSGPLNRSNKGPLHTWDPPCPGGQSWSPSPAAAPAECLQTCWGKQPGLCCVGSAQSSWHRAAPSGSCVWRSCCWWTSGRLPGDATATNLPSKERIKYCRVLVMDLWECVTVCVSQHGWVLLCEQTALLSVALNL